MPAKHLTQSRHRAFAAFDVAFSVARKSKLRCAVLACLVTLVTVGWCIAVRGTFTPVSHQEKIDHFVFAGVENRTPLAFPNAFTMAWTAHPHLVVIGIPMGNDATSLAFHEYHGRTFGSLPDVARIQNGFSGLALPIYVAGSASAAAPYWAPAVKERSDRDGNILIVRSIEREKTTKKVLGEPGGTHYGPAAMFTNARKVSLWFRFAYQHFRYTPFLAKGDLDTYINVPAYLTILQQLPRVSTLYGRSRPYQALTCHGEHLDVYVIGPLYTETRDIAREVFSDLPARIFEKPFNERLLDTYRRYRFVNEDFLHAHILYFRYLHAGVQRPFPVQEFNDAVRGAARLPPVAGLGKVYMDHVLAESPDMPLSGTVDGLLGYRYNYTLPGPLNRTHFVYVLDNCRTGDELVVNPRFYGVFSHRLRSLQAFEGVHRKYDTQENAFHQLTHPLTLDAVEENGVLYRVDVSSIYCDFPAGVLYSRDSRWPPCRPRVPLPY